MPGPARNRRVSLAWPRLPAAAEVAIVAAGYFGYALVRLAVRASRPAAIAHAAGLWHTERWLHLDVEPWLSHLAAARPALAETAGYYYGLAHFIVTPLVLAWLWLRRPAAFGPLRSALVLGHHRRQHGEVIVRPQELVICASITCITGIYAGPERRSDLRSPA